jgi:hypothetical protein
MKGPLILNKLKNVHHVGFTILIISAYYSYSMYF